LLAEGIFLLFVGACFAYLLIASRQWQAGAALVPTIIGALGLPLLAIHIAQRVLSSRRTAGPRAQILDIAFTDSDLDPKVARRRLLRFVAWSAGLVLGVWLVGFHVIVPVYLFGYLIRYGQVRWWVALVTAIAFEAVLIGLYDEVLHSAWNDPLIQRWLGIGQ
jgi:hypothetical protein